MALQLTFNQKDGGSIPSGPTNMIIHVTREDIAQGARRNSELCPIARALHRHGFTDYLVDCAGTEDGGVRCWMTIDSVSQRMRSARGTIEIDLPSEVALFVANFDSGERPEPFSFELDYKP